jgi:uncharacterized CHY-type Zn-finger protein
MGLVRAIHNRPLVESQKPPVVCGGCDKQLPQYDPFKTRSPKFCRDCLGILANENDIY